MSVLPPGTSTLMGSLWGLETSLGEEGTCEELGLAGEGSHSGPEEMSESHWGTQHPEGRDGRQQVTRTANSGDPSTWKMSAL